jgi:peptide/nickel transport system substrate-binding protein
MRSSARRAALVAAAGAVAALVVAVPVTASADSSSPSPSGSAAKPVTMTIGITSDIDSANPFTGYSSLAYEVFALQYPTLTQYGAKDFSIVPGLADSWSSSPDGLVWTYKIHPGMKWSDGQPMTAKDAAYTFDRIIKGEYEKNNFGSYVRNMVSAAAPDDTTLVLTLSKPTPVMDHLYVFILPQHIWSKIDEKAVVSYTNEGTPTSPTVGDGPYVMVERKTRQFVRLTANPNFHRGKPAVDEIVYKIYKNGDALGAALKKGEIDFAEGLGANVAATLKGAPGVTIVKAAPATFYELGFNTGAALDDGTPIGDGNPLLKDKALRSALGWAIDRQTLVDKVLNGGGLPGSTVIPPLYVNWHIDPSTPSTYDPAKAKAALDAAGYPVGSDGVRVDKAGKRLSFRLFARSDDPESVKAVDFIKGYLAAVGVETTVKAVDEGTLGELVGQGKYDMFEWDWGVEPDPNYMLNTFTCASRSYKDSGSIVANLSDSFYCNPEYDKLNALQTSTIDVASRKQTVAQMQQMLYDDAPYVVTYYKSNFEGYRSDRFTNFTPQPADSGTLFFQWATWSYESMTPVTAATTASTSSGMSPALIAGIVAALVALIAIVVVVSRRRRGDVADTTE